MGGRPGRRVQSVKKELSRRPLLRYPEFTELFVLATDASVAGSGEVLMQKSDGALQPVVYANKTTSEAEAKYSITELECFVVVWAVKLFRPYLY